MRPLLALGGKPKPQLIDMSNFMTPVIGSKGGLMTSPRPIRVNVKTFNENAEQIFSYFLVSVSHKDYSPRATGSQLATTRREQVQEIGSTKMKHSSAVHWRNLVSYLLKQRKTQLFPAVSFFPCESPLLLTQDTLLPTLLVIKYIEFSPHNSKQFSVTPARHPTI